MTSEQPPPTEYLVISRGQWDETLSRDDIQSATEKFYVWYDRLIDEGKMKPGQRLTSEGKTVARKKVITDGPFGESKEVIGGYWFILAQSLDEAVQIAKGNPCLACGLSLEIRPIDSDPIVIFTAVRSSFSPLRASFSSSSSNSGERDDGVVE
jgi:hypothetical protein